MYQVRVYTTVQIYVILKTHLLICSKRICFHSGGNFSHKTRGQFFESLDISFALEVAKQLLERR